MKTASPSFAAKTDGRRARTADSKRRIVEAMMELMREGDVAPTAESVATRSGVGLRTVFRLFNDMDSLYREIHVIMSARLQPIADEPFEPGNEVRRLEQLVERRARILEQMMPFKTAADVHRARSPFLTAGHRDLVQLLRIMLLRAAPSIAGKRDLLEALDLTLSFESWRRLRTDQGLSPQRARAVLLQMVRALTKAIG
jgi:AcrR family transcriptional regulator